MRRGDVYNVRFEEDALPGEAAGERPCIVVSSNEINGRLETVVVVPASASDFDRQKEFKNNVVIRQIQNPGFDKDCVAQVHLVRHVSKQRVGTYRGRVSDEVLDDMSVTLGVVLESRNPMDF